MTKEPVNKSFAFAEAHRGVRHVFVRGLEVHAVVGVYDHEKHTPQRLIISVDLNVAENAAAHNDRLENVVCYEGIVRNIQKICTAGHVNLLETLAEKIAADCLEDKRVLVVKVSIEKPDILPECTAVGIEIERKRASF